MVIWGTGLFVLSLADAKIDGRRRQNGTKIEGQARMRSLRPILGVVHQNALSVCSCVVVCCIFTKFSCLVLFYLVKMLHYNILNKLRMQ